MWFLLLKCNLLLVITKGYGVQTTSIEGENAFAHRCTLRKLHVTDSKNIRDQITSDKSPNAGYQIAFCAFHSFLVEVQSIATWRLRLRAPLVARNYCQGLVNQLNFLQNSLFWIFVNSGLSFRYVILSLIELFLNADVYSYKILCFISDLKGKMNIFMLITSYKEFEIKSELNLTELKEACFNTPSGYINVMHVIFTFMY